MRSNLLGAALIALIVPIAAQAEVSGGVVKIGVLTDMAGVTADVTGKGSLVAAEMAVREFGGTVLGKPVQVISADHQHKPDIGTGIARQWFDVEGVDAIVDVPNSGVALAIQGLAREKKKIVLYSGAGTTALTNEQCSPFGVHWTYDTYAVSHGTASAVVEAGGTTWFFLAADYAFGQQLQKDASDVIAAAGGKVLGAVRHPLNTPDFSSFLLTAQSSGAKIIGIANAGNDTINAMKQANEYGIVKGGQSLAAMILFLQDIHTLGLEAAQGTYLTTASYWDMNEATRAWSREFMVKTGAPPSMLHAGVYGAVRHYLKAVTQAGTDDAERVAAAMRAIPIDDIFSQGATLREDGRVTRTMYLARVKKPSESKYPWDYLEIVRPIPSEQTAWPLSESKCPLVKGATG
ncbi:MULTISPECIES: ABC transporter substrate-binding protein [Bradyrhizobium]|uniref:Branched-chain amino acid transport system substrate-binding protein n=1 Tax=Bradyrhizobium ottawaense TaxID=931866 RepID=A0ABV4FKZ9_9BRAD|nr:MULTISPECIES: ABC transporter substrate-binding protein [Bradyrhizobium]MBR1290590.1 ABC transporter substrate-binding protein [Bradyrhizobium ottawaense]WLB44988.1 ABC transporter substrate-binding protein [Bradyrhizobium ottawaense]WQN82285.1 ABC transporter substrate-binding protein [Bradyrhizobium ottawaense]